MSRDSVDIGCVLSRGRVAGWVLFAAMFLPALITDLQAIPVLVFWFVPVTLPFWFGALAAGSFFRIRRTGTAGAWTAWNIGILILGLILLPLWLLMSVQAGHTLIIGRGVAILYLALIPAALKLFTGRTREWRLGRAIWLNAVGCLLFGLDITAAIALAGEIPGPSIWAGIPALVVIAIAGRKLELASPERSGGEEATLPKAKIETRSH